MRPLKGRRSASVHRQLAQREAEHHETQRFDERMREDARQLLQV